MMYMGQTGTNIQTFKFEEDEDCPVCSTNYIEYEIGLDTKVYTLVERIEKEFKVSKVTLNCEDGKYLYAAVPPVLFEKHKYKMEKTFQQLIDDGELVKGVNILVFSKDLPTDVKLQPKYV